MGGETGVAETTRDDADGGGGVGIVGRIQKRSDHGEAGRPGAPLLPTGVPRTTPLSLTQAMSSSISSRANGLAGSGGNGHVPGPQAPQRPAPHPGTTHRAPGRQRQQP